MGIIVNGDYEYSADCAVTVSNYYINIKEIIIVGVTQITYAYQIYSNQTARLNNKQYMTRIVKDITITGALPTDVYAFVYSDLKTGYTSYVDV